MEFMISKSCEESEFELLCTNKVICFLILFIQTKEDKKANEFLRFICKQIDEEAVEEETELDEAEMVFYNKDTKVLKALEIIFSLAVIPFIQYTRDNLSSEKDFRDFELAATMNPLIFHEFAKYISRNYIFERDSISEYSGSDKRVLNKKQFNKVLREEYEYVFEPKMIRLKFIEFVQENEEKAFARPSMIYKQSIVPDSVNLSIRDTIDEEFLKGPFYKCSQETDVKGRKFLDKLDQFGEKKPKKIQKLDLDSDQNDRGMKDSRNNYDEGSSGTPFYPESSSCSEEHKSDASSRYRADDTINIIRKSNLSFINQRTKCHQEDQELFYSDLEKRYGSKLLGLFKTHYDIGIKDGKYNCTYKTCKLPYIRSKSFNDPQEGEFEVEKLEKDFSHSFKFLSLIKKKEVDEEVVTGQSYLKKIIRKNVSPRDFRRFYENKNSGSGILNSYLRILEVYSELRYEKMEYLCPSKHIKKIKFFETSILKELHEEISSKKFSKSLDEELQDCLDHHCLVIPITKDDIPYLFIVKQSKNKLKVTLYYQESIVSKDDEERMTELSGVILNLLKRAYDTVCLDFNEDSVTGESYLVSSVAQMCEVVEKIVLEDDRDLRKVDEEEVRHKIVDVVLSVYFLC